MFQILRPGLTHVIAIEPPYILLQVLFNGTSRENQGFTEMTLEGLDREIATLTHAKKILEWVKTAKRKVVKIGSTLVTIIECAVCQVMPSEEEAERTLSRLLRRPLCLRCKEPIQLKSITLLHTEDHSNKEFTMMWQQTVSEDETLGVHQACVVQEVTR